MGKITIVGMGLGDFDSVSLSAWRELLQSTQLVLHTENHPLVKELDSHKVRYQCADDVFAKEGALAIIDGLIELSRGANIHYAVPGHPLANQPLVNQLVARSKQFNIEIRIVPNIGCQEVKTSAEDVKLSKKSIDRLLKIMVHLRCARGCPWDKEQTHKSLRPFLLEETYEVLEALSGDDMHKLCEELGDLLLQIVFHAHIGQEEQHFDFGDVVEGIVAKLERRHPHIFGDISVDGSDQVVHNWEAIKNQEREAHHGLGASILDDVSQERPALMQASKIQSKAANVGFDWKSITGTWDKLCEEIKELRQACESGSKERIEAELGDVLFAVVNVARFLNVDSEIALLQTITKFRNRFAHIEQQIAKRKALFSDFDIKQLDIWWDEAKNKGL